MKDRQFHQPEVQAFLQRSLGGSQWELTLPHGWGNETYFARCAAETYFIKLGVQVSRYQAMATLGLTPGLVVSGCLSDGTSLIVQHYISGKSPSRADYRAGMERVAAIIHQVHHSPQVRHSLPPAASDLYRAAGLEVLKDIQSRWQRLRPLVPESAGFVDVSLATLAEQVASFQGSGLVAAHNDICNANWLVTPHGQWYLIDLESMALGDPALDIGATLWWYYPPELWPRFLELVGYARDPNFEFRMRVRMALHCLHILLPRPGSFDTFNPATFSQALRDFKAALAGEPNPEMNA
jgi:thiamine kinase-like enzyme